MEIVTITVRLTKKLLCQFSIITVCLNVNTAFPLAPRLKLTKRSSGGSRNKAVVCPPAQEWRKHFRDPENTIVPFSLQHRALVTPGRDQRARI